MKKSIKLLVTILFISFFSCDNEIVSPVEADAEDVIQVDSETYNLLQRVANAPEEESEITCIDFVYPLTIFTYDEDLMFLESHQINNDIEFSTLLGGLESSQSISLSLPITTILDGGLSLNISSYEELQESIDDCMDNDFLAYCNTNLPSEDCIWKVIENGEYTGAYFSINDDGSVTYNEDGTNLIGTWVVSIINDEVHLNINLEGNSEAVVTWNHDWLISLTNEGHFQLNNGTDTAILEKDCEVICDNLNFRECETDIDSGMAEFDLTSYTNCILSQSNIEDPSTVTVTFHVSQADADANTNAIIGTHTNTDSPQTIFVRIENNASSEVTYVSITIEAISC